MRAKVLPFCRTAEAPEDVQLIRLPEGLAAWPRRTDGEVGKRGSVHRAARELVPSPRSPRPEDGLETLGVSSSVHPPPAPASLLD